jgi:hypothetical protein
MSSNTPPNPYVPSTYNPAYWTTTTSTSGITQDQLNNALATKLNYPTAQGGETFPSGLSTSLINFTNSTPSQPIGYTITGYYPFFQTLPNEPNSDGSPQYNMTDINGAQVQLLIGATYLISTSITLNGTAGSYTGVGFTISLRGSLYSTQSSDWTYITSQISQQGITTTSNNTLVFMTWTQPVYIDPAVYKIIPSNTTTNVWIGAGGWSGSSAQNPTGTWTFSNIIPSYTQFTRIA